MKVMVLRPGRVLAAGAMAALLVAGAVLGCVALLGSPGGERAQAYGKNNVGSVAWYFAEGHTGDGFEEWISIFNPPYEVGGVGKVALVSLSFYGPQGRIGGQNYQVEPGQRISVNVNNELMRRYNYVGDVSVVVTDWGSNVPLICERAMYYNYRGQVTGGSQTLGYQEAEVAAYPY